MFTRIFYAFIALSIASSAEAIDNKSTLREISISLLEIDPKEVGSKARPERRRVIEGSLQLAIADRANELANAGLKLNIEHNNLYQAPESAGTAVKKAMAGNSLAGIGLPTSYYAEHGGLASQNSDFMIVSPFATSTKLARFENNLIMLMPLNDVYAKAFGAMVEQEIGAKKIAIVVPWDNAFSQNFYQELPNNLKKHSILIKVIDDQQNLESVAKKIDAIKPDAAILVSFPAFTGKLIRTMYEKGFRGIYAGPSSWGEGEDKPLHKLTNDLPIKAFTLRETSEYFTTPQQKEFIEKFIKNTGLTYSAESGLYFDSINLIIDRIVKIGKDVTRSQLTEALRASPNRCGIFSNICTSKTAIKRTPFYLVSYENGKFLPKKVIYFER